MKQKTITINGSIVATIMLCVVIVAASIFSIMKINDVAEEGCWDTLATSVAGLETTIESQFNSDKGQLIALGKLLSEYGIDNHLSIQHTLSQSHSETFIDELAILYPNETILTEHGEYFDASNDLDFEEIASKGAHLSDRVHHLKEKDKQIIRHYVPIVRDGETLGILYGIINLATLSEKLETSAYNGKAAVYIIDGKTGDFLVDTWHSGQTLGNIKNMGKREMKSGYEFDELRHDLPDSKTSYVAFESQTTGEYLYFYYNPIDINNWIVALSVPESAVFERADKIRSILYSFACFEMLVFVVYFIWILYRMKRESAEKQKRLDAISYIYDVEKLLFSAHHNESQLTTALSRVAEATNAECAFFKILESSKSDRVYIWSSNSENQNKFYDILEHHRFFEDEFLRENDEFIVHDIEKIGNNSDKKQEYFKNTNLANFMEVPVKDQHNKPIGMLGVINMKKIPANADMLKNVSLSFGMIYNNILLFERIKEMGENDYLTGLKNRNSYEAALKSYASSDFNNFACIYADANGLHELNNKHGHESGDKMLKDIASCFLTFFGFEHSYRIGGDEFIAFSIEQNEEAIKKNIESIEKELNKMGYAASFGMSFSVDGINTSSDLNALIKVAEANMYQNKLEYYKNNANNARL